MGHREWKRVSRQKQRYLEKKKLMQRGEIRKEQCKDKSHTERNCERKKECAIGKKQIELQYERERKKERERKRERKRERERERKCNLTPKTLLHFSKQEVEHFCV